MDVAWDLSAIRIERYNMKVVGKHHWKPPDANSIKISVDDAFSKANHQGSTCLDSEITRGADKGASIVV